MAKQHIILSIRRQQASPSITSKNGQDRTQARERCSYWWAFWGRQNPGKGKAIGLVVFNERRHKVMDSTL
ncbi:hypothetical protein G6F43_014034 [Rhizopus delemar]|nr:hypothetical protein G6F43_014034 [Rhizopus delemar]